MLWLKIKIYFRSASVSIIVGPVTRTAVKDADFYLILSSRRQWSLWFHSTDTSGHTQTTEPSPNI